MNCIMLLVTLLIPINASDDLLGNLPWNKEVEVYRSRDNIKPENCETIITLKNKNENAPEKHKKSRISYPCTPEYEYFGSDYVIVDYRLFSIRVDKKPPVISLRTKNGCQRLTFNMKFIFKIDLSDEDCNKIEMQVLQKALVEIGQLPGNSDYKVFRHEIPKTKTTPITKILILKDQQGIDLITYESSIRYKHEDDRHMVVDGMMYSNSANSVVVLRGNACEERSYQDGKLSVSWMDFDDCSKVKLALVTAPRPKQGFARVGKFVKPVISKIGTSSGKRNQ